MFENRDHGFLESYEIVEIVQENAEDAVEIHGPIEVDDEVAKPCHGAHLPRIISAAS